MDDDYAVIITLKKISPGRSAQVSPTLATERRLGLDEERAKKLYADIVDSLQEHPVN